MLRAAQHLDDSGDLRTAGTLWITLQNLLHFILKIIYKVRLTRKGPRELAAMYC